MSEHISLKQALAALQIAIRGMIAERDALDKSNINEILEFYKKIYDTDNVLSELYDVLHGVKENYSHEVIPNLFESMEIDSIKRKSGNFIVGSKLNASIPFDQREQAHKWLIDNGLGALITPSVNARSLSSAIKEHIEATAIEPPSDCIKIHRQKYTSIRKV